MMFTFQLSTYTPGLPASPYLRLLNKYYTKVGTLMGVKILQQSAVTLLIKQKYFFLFGSVHRNTIHHFSSILS